MGDRNHYVYIYSLSGYLADLITSYPIIVMFDTGNFITILKNRTNIQCIKTIFAIKAKL